MGLFETLGASGAAPAPKLAAVEQYFDARSAALMRAALDGEVQRVNALVAAGADPNSHGPRSASLNTPQISLLGYAIGQHSAAAVQLLIHAGADPTKKPREDDGNAFLFAIVRKDSTMLDALYRAWPAAKVPPKTQSADAFSALRFDCGMCLEVMFKHGVPVDVRDARGYNLFMEALSREDFKMAEWLLKDVGVSLDVETPRGVTPANQLQLQIGRYKPGTPTMEGLLRLQSLMRAHGIVFPVETSEQWRASRGIK